MKDFIEMTADEIKNYNGPVYGYSAVFVKDGQRYATDGDHVSPEAAEQTFEEIKAERESNGWRLQYEVEYFQRTKKKKTDAV